MLAVDGSRANGPEKTKVASSRCVEDQVAGPVSCAVLLSRKVVAINRNISFSICYTFEKHSKLTKPNERSRLVM